MTYGKERTVVLKDGTTFTGKKVFNFWEGFFETTYKVTKESNKFLVGARIKTAAFTISHVIIRK